MKGGWAGAKVASAPGVPPSPAEGTVGSAHTQGGGTGMTGAADRSAQRAVSRAESFPHRGKFAPRRVSTMQNQGPAHARPKALTKAPRGTLSF